MHPEKLTTAPTARRWVLGDNEIPAGFAPGRLTACPGPLGVLIEQGIVTDVIAEAGALWLWLCDGESWRSRGAEVRDAIVSSVRSDTSWSFEPLDAQVVGMIADEVLQGRVGDFISSHGGEIALEQARPEGVEVRFGGVCASCSAMWITLGSKVRAGMQERLPGIPVTADGAGC